MENDPAEDIEQLANGVLSILIRKREFVEKIEEHVQEELNRMQSTREPPNFSSPGCSKETTLRPSQLLAELSRSVESVSQTFAENVRILYKDDEVLPNRDASFLFSLRLQIERLKEKPSPERVASSVVRLIHAVKLFSKRVSSSINVPNVSIFANNLADLLFAVDSAAHSLNLENCQVLHDSVRSFNDTVVPSLARIKKEMETEKIVKLTPRTPHIPPKRKPLVPVQQKSAGYLVSRQPRKDGQRSAVTRSRSVPRTKNPNPTTTHNTAVQQSARRVKNKWIRILNAESLLRNSTEPSECGNATRAARMITAEVVKELHDAYGENGLLIITK